MENLGFVHLIEVAPSFWNLRAPFPMLGGLIDIGTHMSFCRLSNGKILIIDTVPINDVVKREVDQLTQNGALIEAVVATHPFHTIYFLPFFNLYPSAKYYGTPRHLRNIPSIRWAGDVSTAPVLNMWNPEVEMRIPDGAEFITPDESNHFSSVFVFHKKGRVIHIDDTVMFFENYPGCILGCCMGVRPGTMSFHPTLRSDEGLYRTSSAPFQFKSWVSKLLEDWDFDNICTAHTGNKIGGAKTALRDTLVRTEPLFQSLAAKHK